MSDIYTCIDLVGDIVKLEMKLKEIEGNRDEIERNRDEIERNRDEIEGTGRRLTEKMYAM